MHEPVTYMFNVLAGTPRGEGARIEELSRGGACRSSRSGAVHVNVERIARVRL